MKLRPWEKAPPDAESPVLRDARRLKKAAEKALKALDEDDADQVDRKQRASLLREARESLKLVGQLTGDIQSKTVRDLLHRMGVKSEAELQAIVESRRHLSSLTIEDLAGLAVRAVEQVCLCRPTMREALLAQVASVGVDPNAVPMDENAPEEE
jgi:hypothetical protein